MARKALAPWADVDPQLPGLQVDVYDGDTPPADVSDVEFYVMPKASRADRELIPRMPALKVLQTLNAGYDDVLPLLPSNACLANGRGLRDTSTSEHALALILACQRDIPTWVRQQDARQWRRSIPRALHGSRVLIVGYGSVGRAIERHLKSFGAAPIRLAGHARPADKVHGINELHELLPGADIVVLTVPLTPATAGLVGRAEFDLMPDGALVVNMSRGPVVDTAALLSQGGRIRAALDVTDPEPLPDGHPLFRCPGVLISPHVGGVGVSEVEVLARRLVAEQLRRFALGEPLLNVVHNPNGKPDSTGTVPRLSDQMNPLLVATKAKESS